MPLGPPLRLVLAVAFLAPGCSAPATTTTTTTSAPAIATVTSSSPPAPPPAPPGPPPFRPHIDGLGFPDHVLALTWDDGPDANTFELAQYLADENVSATFFVVNAWAPGVSADPGEGRGVFATGFTAIPVLEDLVALGHRIANHTLNHALLNYIDAANVVYQLRENQALIDPLITNEMRVFRAPGGGWNADASRAVDGDPETARLVGPIRWDIDGKDWEKTLYCRSDHPAVECERAPRVSDSRVKTKYIARRYLELADRVGRGIVLFHDRLGHVGSHIAVDLARMVIPELKARGFVFVAPVLRFSPLAPRSPDSPGDFTAATAIELVDVDGDGKADVCATTPAGPECALATIRTGLGRYPEAALRPAQRWPRAIPASASADAIGSVDFAAPGAVVRSGDINGDGRADVCATTRDGIACALATSRGLTKPTIWVSADAVAKAGWDDPRFAATLRLGDINGDHRADLCGLSANGVVCGLAP